MTRMKSSLALAIAAFFLLAGCSGGKDKKAAFEAISESVERDAAGLSVDLGRVGDPCGDIPAFATTPDLTAQTGYYSARKAGLITITPDGSNFWKVELVTGDRKSVV